MAGGSAFVRVWVAWLVLMTGINLATPFYPVYADRFGFSSLVLTAIFAAYAVVLVPALVVFGRLSDAVGRRRVMLAGLAVACAGLALFAAARGTGWLFAARVLQGLAVGMISAPATAALVELEPGADERRPALLAGLAQSGGAALGPLLAGVLAEWAPAPRQLPFLVVLALTAAGATVVWKLPEPAADGREPWRLQRPRVPRRLLGDFARVAATAAVAWASVALYLSIVPSYTRTLLSTSDLALLGVVAAVVFLASCAAQFAAHRVRPPARGAQAVGLVVVALGLVALAVASPTRSFAVLLAGAVVTGVGHGFAFVAAQDELNGLAPAERRGEVTAAFIGVIYALVATAVVASGLLDRGLTLGAAVIAVALALAAAAAAAAAWQVSGALRRRGRGGWAAAGSARRSHGVPRS